MTCSWDISAILLDVNNRHIAPNWRREDWVREGQVFTNIARQILKVKFTKYLTTVYFPDRTGPLPRCDWARIRLTEERPAPFKFKEDIMGRLWKQKSKNKHTATSEQVFIREYRILYLLQCSLDWLRRDLMKKSTLQPWFENP